MYNEKRCSVAEVVAHWASEQRSWGSIPESVLLEISLSTFTEILVVRISP